METTHSELLGRENVNHTSFIWVGAYCLACSMVAFSCLHRLLNETKGSLLDDEQLVNTLQTSKTTSQEVSEQLQISEQTEIKIDAAREVRAGLISSLRLSVHCLLWSVHLFSFAVFAFLLLLSLWLLFSSASVLHLFPGFHLFPYLSTHKGFN